MMAVNDVKWLVPCVGALLIGSVVYSPLPTAADALPQAAASVSPAITPIILTDTWPIKRVIANRAGALVFAGGDFRGGADGLVYIAPDKFLKLAAIGDPVPGRDGAYLVEVGFINGLNSDFRFNAQGDLAFTAGIVNCGSPSQVTQCAASTPLRAGLFLFSEKARTTIALEGDPVPGVAGGTFQSFFPVRLNDHGEIAFSATLLEPDGSSTRGLFYFSGGRVDKILLTGDVTPFGSDPIGFLGDYLFLNDEGAVTFYGHFKAGDWSILRYQNGLLSRVFGAGDSAPWGGSLGSLWAWEESEQGFDVVNSGKAVYVHAKDGSLSKIVAEGDTTPVGGQYVLVYMVSHNTSGVGVGINDSGEPAFGPLRNAGPASGGIFLNARGGIEKIAVDGDPVPGVPDTTMSIGGYDLNNLGMAAFSSRADSQRGFGLFLYSKGITHGVYLPGDQAPQTDGSFRDLNEFVLTDAGEVIFHSTVCCGRVKEGIFRARFPRASIPNGSFETSGDNGLPSGWQLTWTNSGSGDVRQYNCGTCTPDGASVMRLHVGVNGGSVFVVSDTIPVEPLGAYMISGRMRYQLNSASDEAFFTILQFDSAGNAIDLTEVQGTRLDNAGNWVPKGMLIRTRPSAASIRIRIGLASTTETTLDVDSVR